MLSCKCPSLIEHSDKQTGSIFRRQQHRAAADHTTETPSRARLLANISPDCTVMPASKKAVSKVAKVAKVAGDPAAPKRPATSFFRFCSSRRDAAVSKLTSAELSQEWRELDAAAKAKFEEAASSARSAYDVAKAEYDERFGKTTRKAKKQDRKPGKVDLDKIRLSWLSDDEEEEEDVAVEEQSMPFKLPAKKRNRHLVTVSL